MTDKDTIQNELSTLIDRLDATEKILASGRSRNRRIATAAAAAVAAAAIATAVFGTSSGGTLTDTYDDPALAYAQVEKAMKTISGKFARGIRAADRASDIIEQQKHIINGTRQ